MSAVTHGGSKTRAYEVWRNMRRRCSDPSFPHYNRYGGRGIVVCERWQNFAEFLADMGQPPAGMTIERIDNDGPYTPGNCRWATRAEQGANKSANRYLTVGNDTLTLAEWARRSGVRRTTLEVRLGHGETIEEAMRPGRRFYGKKPSAPPSREQILAAAQASAKARKARTHCKNGHEWNEVNTGWQKTGRMCRVCHWEKVARQREAKKKRAH